jgi:hypothetical protein
VTRTWLPPWPRPAHSARTAPHGWASPVCKTLIAREYLPLAGTTPAWPTSASTGRPSPRSASRPRAVTRQPCAGSGRSSPRPSTFAPSRFSAQVGSSDLCEPRGGRRSHFALYFWSYG